MLIKRYNNVEWLELVLDKDILIVEHIPLSDRYYSKYPWKALSYKHAHMKHNSRSVSPFQYSPRSHSSQYLSNEWYAAELAGPNLKRNDRTMNNEGSKHISRVSPVFCLCLNFKPEIKKSKFFPRCLGIIQHVNGGTEGQRYTILFYMYGWTKVN